MHRVRRREAPRPHMLVLLVCMDVYPTFETGERTYHQVLWSIFGISAHVNTLGWHWREGKRIRGIDFTQEEV